MHCLRKNTEMGLGSMVKRKLTILCDMDGIITDLLKK